MSKIADQSYLLSQQYRSDTNLNARIQLHARFSSNRYGWHPWAFDQLEIAPDARILELGCGPGQLWLQNLARIPPGWQITLSDFSPGMLDAARQNLAGGGRAFTFEQIDAQNIPCADASFDVLIANHMLYHVPDRPRALAEIRRVLRPAGHFYATTIGISHLRELHELEQRLLPGLRAWQARPEHSFLLENGAEQIAPLFAHVELRRYEDALLVTEAEPLVAFMLSHIESGTLSDPQRAALQESIQQQIARDGAIHITKDSGLFAAW